MTQRKTGTRRTGRKRKNAGQDGESGNLKTIVISVMIVVIIAAGSMWHVNLKKQTAGVLSSVQKKEKALQDVKRIYRNREARVEAFISENYIQHQIQKYDLRLVKVTEGQVCHIGGEKTDRFRRDTTSKLAFLE